MQTNTPKVSIGLPVFNGERYLEQSIQSILAQTFTDFELIISDNASTDRTDEICLRYAAQDARVRYDRNPTNIGGSNNHNLTFLRSRGEYFRWAAHDDVCDPRLLTECLKILEQEPNIIVCYPMSVEIDENNRQIQVVSTHVGMAEKPWQRFRQLFSRNHDCEATYGLIRSSVLRRTKLLQNYTGSDRTLLSELGLYGKFYEISQPLFYKRCHPQNTYVDWRTRMAWFFPSMTGKIVFPFWNQFFDYLRIIKRTPLSRKEKLYCYSLLLSVWMANNGKRMFKDLLIAFQMAIHSPEWRQKRYARTRNWS